MIEQTNLCLNENISPTTNEDSQITQKQEDITNEIGNVLKSQEKKNIGRPSKLKISKKDLENLYNKQFLSTEKISKLLNVSRKVIEKRMKKFGLSSYIRIVKNQPVLRILSESYEKFINLIKPHVPWQCFKYKIDLTEFKKAHKAEKQSNQKGVTYKKKIDKWNVTFYKNGETLQIGQFKILEEAIIARKKIEKLYEN